MRAVHQVAAAEQVADAILASVAVEVRRVGGLIVTRVFGEDHLAVFQRGHEGHIVARGQLGVVHVHKHRGRGGHRAAVVVAAEDRVNGAAVDVDGDTVGGVRQLVAGHADKGVLGTAEERVDKDIVIAGMALDTHNDVARLDVGDAAAAALALLGEVEVVAAGAVVGVIVKARRHGGDAADGAAGRVPGIDVATEAVLSVVEVVRQHVAAGPRLVASGIRQGVEGVLVGIVAAAATVGIAYVHRVRRAGERGAQLQGGMALHPARNVVAAIDGIDRVAAVHRDAGVAARDDVVGVVARVIAHIGHSAAADQIAADDRTLGGRREVGMRHLLRGGDGAGLPRGRAVVEVDDGGYLHAHAVGRHIVAMDGDGVLRVGCPDGTGHTQREVALRRARQRVDDAVHTQRSEHLSRRIGVPHIGTVLLVGIVVMVGIARHTGAAEFVIYAHPPIGVDAVAVQLLMVLRVGRGDTHAVLVGGPHVQLQLLYVEEFHAIHKRGVVARLHHAQALEAQVVGHRGVLAAVCGGLHRQHHRAGTALHLVAVAQRARAEPALVQVVHLLRGVVVPRRIEEGVGTLIAVARHGPLALVVGRAGGVVHQPIVRLHTGQVAVGHLLYGGAEVPVVPQRQLLGGLARSHLHHLQPCAAANQVVAVAVPHLEVVARHA